MYRQNESATLCANNFNSDSVNTNKFSKGVGGIVKMHDFNSYVDPNFALQETKIIVPFLKSRGYSFVSPTLEFSHFEIDLVKAGQFSDQQKSVNKYFKSIRLGDINGDGKADIIGRNVDGVQVALATGLGFANEEIWSKEFSDKQGWALEKYSSTLRWADVNGDHKADLIIRSRVGIRVALSTGNGFEQSTLWTNYFSDDTDQN